jgi:hypothetical protein
VAESRLAKMIEEENATDYRQLLRADPDPPAPLEERVAAALDAAPRYVRGILADLQTLNRRRAARGVHRMASESVDVLPAHAADLRDVYGSAGVPGRAPSAIVDG